MARSAEEREAQLDEALSKLKGGQILVKYSSNGQSVSLEFSVNQSGTRVCWGSSQEDSAPDDNVFELINAVRIVKGRSTSVFESFGSTAPSDDAWKRSFSIVSNSRSIDLECPTEEDCDLWVLGLQYLMYYVQNDVESRTVGSTAKLSVGSFDLTVPSDHSAPSSPRTATIIASSPFPASDVDLLAPDYPHWSDPTLLSFDSDRGGKTPTPPLLAAPPPQHLHLGDLGRNTSTLAQVDVAKGVPQAQPRSSSAPPVSAVTDAAVVVAAALASPATPASATSSNEFVWQPDKTAKTCTLCDAKFTVFRRKHHCRKCGSIVCEDCSKNRLLVNSKKEKRVCSNCYLLALSERLPGVSPSQIAEIKSLRNEINERRTLNQIDNERQLSRPSSKNDQSRLDDASATSPLAPTAHLDIGRPPLGTPGDISATADLTRRLTQLEHQLRERLDAERERGGAESASAAASPATGRRPLPREEAAEIAEIREQIKSLEEWLRAQRPSAASTPRASAAEEAPVEAATDVAAPLGAGEEVLPSAFDTPPLPLAHDLTPLAPTDVTLASVPLAPYLPSTIIDTASHNPKKKKRLKKIFSRAKKKSKRKSTSGLTKERSNAVSAFVANDVIVHSRRNSTDSVLSDGAPTRAEGDADAEDEHSFAVMNAELAEELSAHRRTVEIEEAAISKLQRDLESSRRELQEQRDSLGTRVQTEEELSSKLRAELKKSQELAKRRESELIAQRARVAGSRSELNMLRERLAAKIERLNASCAEATEAKRSLEEVEAKANASRDTYEEERATLRQRESTLKREINGKERRLKAEEERAAKLEVELRAEAERAAQIIREKEAQYQKELEKIESDLREKISLKDAELQKRLQEASSDSDQVKVLRERVSTMKRDTEAKQAALRKKQQELEAKAREEVELLSVEKAEVAARRNSTQAKLDLLNAEKAEVAARRNSTQVKLEQLNKEKADVEARRNSLVQRKLSHEERSKELAKKLAKQQRELETKAAEKERELEQKAAETERELKKKATEAERELAEKRRKLEQKAMKVGTELSEKQQEFALNAKKLEIELSQKEKDLERKTKSVEVTLTKKQQELDHKAKSVEVTLAEKRRELDHRVKSAEVSLAEKRREAEERARRLEKEAAELKRRKADAESRLEKEAAELKRRKADDEARARQLEERARHQERQLEEERSRVEAERREYLRRREQLEKEQMALQKSLLETQRQQQAQMAAYAQQQQQQQQQHHSQQMGDLDQYQNEHHHTQNGHAASPSSASLPNGVITNGVASSGVTSRHRTPSASPHAHAPSQNGHLTTSADDTNIEKLMELRKESRRLEKLKKELDARRTLDDNRLREERERAVQQHDELKRETQAMRHEWDLLEAQRKEELREVQTRLTDEWQRVEAERVRFEKEKGAWMDRLAASLLRGDMAGLQEAMAGLNAATQSLGTTTTPTHFAAKDPQAVHLSSTTNYASTTHMKSGMPKRDIGSSPSSHQPSGVAAAAASAAPQPATDTSGPGPAKPGSAPTKALASTSTMATIAARKKQQAGCCKRTFNCGYTDKDDYKETSTCRGCPIQ